MSKKGFIVPYNKHLGNKHTEWNAPQVNSSKVIINPQPLNWIKVTDQLPDLDIIVLGYSNGAFCLVERYGECFFDSSLNKVDIQYWCKITPQSKYNLEKDE